MEPTGIGDEMAKIFLDGMPIARFLVYYAVALFGMYVLFAFQVGKSIKNNPKTPSRFSWKRLFSFWSVLRLIASMGVLAIAVVNYEGLIGSAFNATVPGPINISGALILGIGIDKTIDALIGGAVNLYRRNGR